MAVKMLHRHLLADPTTRARLTQEARAAASLSHPGIVAVYDVAIDEEAAAVILELVEGETLADRLRREVVLPPREAARIAAEVADALSHAHERGVVHRDVKAANVLLGLDGEARLADFGIARVLEEEATRLTDTGMIAGTLLYLAPEQLRGEPAGPPADVYGVGVLLAEMLSGQPPYQVSTPLALAEAQRTPPLAIGDAPPSLAVIVRQALDPDPERRPPSSGALAAGLREWLVGDAAPPPIDSAPDAPTLPAIPVPPVPPIPAVPAGSPPTAPDRPRPRWPSPATARAIAAVAAFAALVLLLLAVTQLDIPGPNLGAKSASPLPSPSATATPAPTPTALSVSEAVDAFKSLVETGEEAGLIEEEAAAELGDLADEVASAADDGTMGRINKTIRDLRRAIDKFEQDGRIGSNDMAASLRTAVDEIDAAAHRER